MLNDTVTGDWLRSLVDRGLLQGPVSDEDACTIDPPETWHAFAGIGGWPLALGDLPCWTMSVPCQPWSVVGQRKGSADSRDLWPAMRDRIAYHRPKLVLGEQVDNAQWIGRWRSDMEALGYRLKANRLSASLAGAPHRRYRWFWCAYTDSLPAVPLMPDAWADGVPVTCRDGETRRLGPVDDEPRKLVRGYGNAIVPQLVGRWLAGEYHPAPEYAHRWDGDRVMVKVTGCPWPTPRAQEGGPASEGYGKRIIQCLPWPTATASTGGPEPEGDTGRKLVSVSPVSVAGVARWLMGYPRGWL